jgi:hypothetical protein
MDIEETSSATEAVELNGVGDIERQGKGPSAESKPVRTDVYHVRGHASNHHDMITTNPPAASSDKYAEAGDDLYEKFSHRRKMVIVAVVSFCACLSPISSTSSALSCA